VKPVFTEQCGDHHLWLE